MSDANGADCDDPSEYCRQIESYLCGKNEGHLIRIVGPAFEMVRGWAEQGVPLKVALRGIDRYCERYYAKGARRRPVRIEFCESDVLDAFDDWRRAIGVAAGADAERSRKPGLASHIERAIARLTALRGGGRGSAAFDELIAGVVRELDALASDAKRARGNDRAAVIGRLDALDHALIQALRAELDPAVTIGLRAEAERELAPFGARMTPDVRARAVEAAFERLARESASLPVLRYD